MPIWTFLHRVAFCTLLLGIGLFATPASLDAQPATYTSRAHVEVPRVLGMGNAAAAIPHFNTSFFYNPAHLTHLRAARAPILMLGLSGTFSPNAPDQYTFYRNHLRPTLEQGLATLPETERQTFLDQVVRPAPALATGALLLPSFAFRRQNYGVGGGLFVNSRLHYDARERPGGFPLINLFSQADFMVVSAGALDLTPYGFRGLSMGLALAYTRRYLMLKSAPLDRLDQDRENYHVLGDGALSTDLGVQYAWPLPRLSSRLLAGAAVQNLLGGHFDYRFVRYYDRNEESLDQKTLDEEIAMAAERLAEGRTYRLGLGVMSTPRSIPAQFSVAAEYLEAPAVASDTFAAHLRLGAEVLVQDIIAVRGGYHGRHATLGCGVQFAFLTIDYAYYYLQRDGYDDGWHHAVQVALGSF